jgi:signal transduction histidine kinase
MSLRLRLILLIVALVTVVVVVLSGLYLNSLVDSISAGALERSELASQQVNAFITDHINRHALEHPNPASPPPVRALPATPAPASHTPASPALSSPAVTNPAVTNMERTKAMWREIVSTDQDISATLVRTMALSPALVEINVAGEDGAILASSNPSRIGQPIKPLENFSDWRSRSLRQRLIDVIVRKPDYQVVAPLGVAGERPVFTTQVAASSVLLRAALLPQVRTVGFVAAGALLVSLLLTGLATSRALRPLRRIEQTIDRIAQGNFGGDDPTRLPADRQPSEFAAVESKLNLLGQQYSGAREAATSLKHSLDEMVERMASQLDVASRFAAISRISGGVAHEIKNPLNAISLHLDLLRARAEASDRELIPEIDVLSKEVRRLDRVVKTFLDFSRPVEVRFSEVDLGALAAEVAHLMTPQARLAGIAVACNTPSEPALIRGDQDMLKQAVLNLVTNAMEAMKHGGNLKISVAGVPNGVTLEVADDGPGIPVAERDKVFQLYFTTKEKGSGIGLAITYRAVQLHNGTVDFASEMGRGTTFRLTFPAMVRHA